MTNAGTLNVTATESGAANGNGAVLVAQGTGLTNSGTFNVSNTGEFIATKVNNTGSISVNTDGYFQAETVTNSGTIEITDSERTFDVKTFKNYTVGEHGTFVLNNSEVEFDEFDNGNGVIKLNNSYLGTTRMGEIGQPTAEIKLADGHQIEVTGDDNWLGGKVSVGNELNVKGTDRTSRFQLDDDVGMTFTGSTPTLTVSNTQTRLDYDNIGNVSLVKAGSEARIGGIGSSTVDFIFDSDSYISPGNSVWDFASKNITFEGGGYIYLEVDFDANDFDRIIAEEDITFEGTTTVFVTKFGDSVGNPISDAKFLIADNGDDDTGKITLGGQNLNLATVERDGNEITISNGTAKVIVMSAKDGKDNDAVLFGDVIKTDESFGFSKLTATSVTPIDPTIPTPGPGPGPNPNPIQGSSNFDALRTVLFSPSMVGKQLNLAIGNTVGEDQKKLVEVVSQLDPVTLSLGSVYAENAIYGFNHAAYERIRLYDNAGTMRGQCDPCEPIGCDPCDPCGSFGSFGGYSSARQMWFQGVGGLINQENADGIAGYDTNVYGFALGVDKKISRNTVVGFGFGNTVFDTDMNQGLGSADTKSYIFSVYSGYKIGAWQLTGTAGYVMSDLSSSRVSTALNNAWANGERDAESYFGSFELARRFNTESGYFTPFLSYDFVQYNEDAFSETGLIGMTIEEREEESYIQTLGARIGTKLVNRRGWIINPSVTMGWIHDFGSGNVETIGAFNEALGNQFTVIGTARHKNRALIGLGIDAELRETLSIFGRYDGELANRYDSHIFQLGLAAQF